VYLFQVLSVLVATQSFADRAVDTKRNRHGRGCSLEEIERAHIITVLEECGWKVRGQDGAAEPLGLKRSTLQSRMKKLGIKRPTT